MYGRSIPEHKNALKVQEVKILPLVEVTKDEFAPYGQIMGREEGKPYEDIPILSYWTKNADLGPDNEKLDAGLLICRKVDRKVTMLERHPLTSENFIPLVGEVIFVMAPADNSKDVPNLAHIRAFFLDGTLGVALHKGTWHYPPIPMRESARMVLLRKGELSDMERRDLKDFDVELRVVM